MQSLQEKFAPKSICFGCGPANDKGLRIRSVVRSGPHAGSSVSSGQADLNGREEVVCEWTPEPHHHAFPGVLNGGICGALLDCHSNWTAAYHLMKAANASMPPCTVTAEFNVQLKRPTPMDAPLTITARVVRLGPDKATVEAEITAKGKVTATCRGVFVAVKEGHPAFHRW